MARKIKVEIVGDASSLHRAFGQAADQGSRFGSTLKTVGKTAAFAVGGAALGGLALTLKAGIDEFKESSEVAAQTAAVLKSTGGAANVTGKQVDKLATSIMNYSGIDDEAIKSGENLLLTFTNIRNETGKGNDIFNQATKTITDMSVALGQDMKSSAIQLGKALNDPIKGVTALQRVGVSFTKDQKKQIESLVKSGHAMEAQKLILGELTKEFGGSAKAAGDTLPGQINKLRQAFNNMAGDLIKGLIPYLQRFVTFVSTNMPTIQAVMATVFEGIAKAIDTVITVVQKSIGWFEKLFDIGKGIVGFFKSSSSQATIATAALGGFAATIVTATVAIKAIEVATKLWAVAQAVLNAVMAANPFVLIAAAIIGLGAALVIAYQRSETFRNIVNRAFTDIKNVVMPIIDALRDAWKRWGDDIIKIVQAFVRTLTAEFSAIWHVVSGVFNIINDLIHGRWGEAWKDAKQLVVNVFDDLKRYLGGLPLTMARLALAVGTAIVNGIIDGLKALAGKAAAELGKLQAALAGIAASAFGWAVGIGQAIIRGIGAGINGLIGWLLDQAGGVVSKVKDKLEFWHSPPEAYGMSLGTRLMQGIGNGIQAASTEAANKAAEAVQKMVEKTRQAVIDSKGKLADAFGELGNAALAAFDKVTDAWVPPAQKILDKINAKEIVKRLNQDLREATQSVTEATTGLAAAQAEGDPAAIQAATDQLKQSLQQQEDAKLAIRKYGLEQQAAQQQVAYDQQREVQRVRLQNELDALAAHVQNMLANHRGGQQEIIKLLKSFEDKYKIRGVALGAALAEGLRDAKGWVVDAANELADAIAKALNVAASVGNLTAKQVRDQLIPGRQSGGPVKAGHPYVVGEAGPELFIPNQSGTIVAGATAGASAVGATINVYVSGVIGDESRVINRIRAGLADVARDNPNIFGSLA